ncbi:MAG TPA: ABC transporter permease [Acetobacteraceae bacterium]
MPGAIPRRSILSLCVGLAAWQAVTMAGLMAPYELPAPSQVLRDFLDVAVNGYGDASLWGSLLVSLLRLAAGMLLAIGIGVATGYLTATNALVKALFDPIFEFVRCIPPLGILGLLVGWLGIGERSKVLLLMLAALIPIVLTTSQAIGAVRAERVQGARSLGLDGICLTRFVILPSALPEILTGIRIGFGYAFGALVAAEMIGASSGLGWMVWNASQYGQTSIVFIDIIAIGCIGFLVDGALENARRRLVPWAGRG